MSGEGGPISYRPNGWWDRFNALPSDHPIRREPDLTARKNPCVANDNQERSDAQD